MIQIVSVYFLVSAILAIRSVLSMESDILLLQSTRSREQKVTTRNSLERKRKDLALCVVWPYNVARALRCIFLHYRGAK